MGWGEYILYSRKFSISFTAQKVLTAYLSDSKPTNNRSDDSNNLHDESLDPNNTRDFYTVEVTFHLRNATACSSWLKQNDPKIFSLLVTDA
jgi:hypothetical protein